MIQAFVAWHIGGGPWFQLNAETIQIARDTLTKYFDKRIGDYRGIIWQVREIVDSEEITQEPL